MSAQPTQLCCGNCACWNRNPNAENAGLCLRHPPTVIALPEKQVDFARASEGVAMRPTRVWPTMNGNEGCFDFIPKPQPAELAQLHAVQ